MAWGRYTRQLPSCAVSGMCPVQSVRDVPGPYRVPLPPPRFFGISGLGRNCRQIFDVKELTRKILKNKRLKTPQAAEFPAALRGSASLSVQLHYTPVQGVGE